MSTSPDGNVRPKFSKKSRKTSTFKTFVSATSAFRKSITRTSTATTVIETPSPSDHVYDRPIPETRGDTFVSSGNLTFAVQKKPTRDLETKPKSEAKVNKITKEPYRLGLTPLHQPSDDVRPDGHYPVDIIALHGINGNLVTTWEEQKPGGRLWLRDFLPGEFPGARIYTFGYDARLFFSLGTGDIDSFAKSLLDDIKNVRVEREEQRRPIIFIAHSMGGLVVKKALTIAKNDPPRFANIREHTSSIFFMATPHRGSDHAAILGAITKIMNLPFASTLINRFTGEIRDDLILGLKKDGPRIKKIATDFKDLTDGSIKFYSFIEMMKTKPLTRRIVDDITGTMDVAAEDVIYMDGRDHQNIVRYDSESCPSYQKVLGNLKRAVDDATNPYHTQTALQDEPCLQSLAFSTMHARRHSTSNAHPTTCTWILTHPLFISWRSSPRGLLWLKGHPGSGKSTLMATLHSSLLPSQTPKSIFLDFFFFAGGEKLQKSPLGMFRSLLWQVYAKSVRAREMILGVYEEKVSAFGREWEWGVSELEKLLKDVVREVARKSEVTIFVDALDEAVDERDEKVALSLLQFFNGLVEQGGVKVCVACRPYPVLGRLGAEEIVVQECNKGDMEKFVLDSLATGVLGWDEEPELLRTGLVDTIVSTSRGVFQWTSQRVPRIIRSLNDGEVSMEEMCSMVAAESSELFDLYQTIFANDVPSHLRGKSLHFLQWVCLAQRPLTLTELRYALACDDEDGSELPACCEESKTFVDSDARIEKLIRSLSGGLAEVRYYVERSTVQFIHETVNDFVRRRGFEFLASNLGMNNGNMIARGENRLSRSCINYLKMDLVAEATLEWHDYGEGTQPPFIDYVCKYWFRHAERAERGGISQKWLVERFKYRSQSYNAWFRASAKLNFSDSRCPSVETKLVHIASGSNLLSVVRNLLQSGTSVGEKDHNGDMPLHWAVREGHEEMASLLLDFGADINVKNRFFPTLLLPASTPLELAAGRGHEKLVRLLLERGADVDGEAIQGGALSAAIKSGNLPLVKILIDNGANIHGIDQGKRNPLHEACMRGNEPAGRLLIEKGADINMQGGEYGNPLQAAILAESEPLVQLLLERGADIHAQGGWFANALQGACVCKDQDVLVRRLLDMGVDVEARGGEYGCALQAACISGSLGVARMLLDAGADVNAQGGFLGTPLIAAAKAGEDGIVRLLLEHGASVDDQGGEYGNVLQAAVISGSRGLVGFFLGKGVSVNVPGGKFGTALQAALVHRPALAELLLERGADVTLPGPAYGNALNAAVFFNRERHVQILLEKGAGIDINTKLKEPTEDSTYESGDYMYAYILQRAAFVGNVKIVKALLDYGADIDAMDGYWGSAITVAAAQGRQDVFELLLERGANVHLDGGLSGSTFKAARKHEKMIELLVERCRKEEIHRAPERRNVDEWGGWWLGRLRGGRPTAKPQVSGAMR